MNKKILILDSIRKYYQRLRSPVGTCVMLMKGDLLAQCESISNARPVSANRIAIAERHDVRP